MRRSVFLFCVLGLVACDDDIATTATDFTGPSASILAGSNFDKLYIANASADALQVLDVVDGVDENRARFITGPTVFNPLLIPVGPNPIDLAASEDGRVVAVLDSVGAAIRLVDADGLRVVREGDSPFVFTLGDASARPAAFEPDPTECFGACLGRFFVSLSGAGQILALSFLEAEVGFRLGLEAVFDVGGRPQRMAATSDGRFLFVVDAASDELVRIERSTGLVERRAVGEPAGDVAVSGDNTVVLVARPGARDVVVFDDIAESLVLLDANARLSPSLSCLAECGADSSVCAGAHPASQVLCAEPGFDGLRLASEPYPGIFLGVIPRRIATLSTTRGNEALSLECVVDDTTAQVNPTTLVAEYAVVVAEGVRSAQSTIRWISLRAEEGGELSPEVADNGFCNAFDDGTTRQPGEIFENAVTFDLEGRVPRLEDYISACPAVPDRSRFQCLNPVEVVQVEGGEDSVLIDPTAGVIVRPGASEGTFEWRLEWEAAYLNAISGGGTLLEPSEDFPGSTVLSDENADLTDAGVRIGDIVDIITAPRTNDVACVEALAALGLTEDACSFERRVIGYESPRPGREFGGLVLGGQFVGDAPQELPRECFGAVGILSYSIRVGDAFAVSRSGFLVGRAGVGELFGPGGRTGQSEPVMFRVQSEFTREGVSGPIPLDSRLTAPACERYTDPVFDPTQTPEEQEAALRAALAPQLQRNQVFRFSVNDRTLPQLPGRLVGAGGSLANGGSGPSSVVYGEAPAETVSGRLGYLFVTYETTDSMVIFRPSRPTLPEDQDFARLE